jgi:hypothetical protein
MMHSPQKPDYPVKTFHCTACQALVFFENTQCLACGRSLAYFPDRTEMLALEPAEEGVWHSVREAVEADSYKLCANYTEHGTCNWALRSDDAESMCRSCLLTRTIPNLEIAGNQEAWAKLETAKRRLIYALLRLNLPVSSKWQDEKQGLEFKFLSDSDDANGDQSRVMTGHDNGIITINVAEADDVYREKERLAHGEPYRTLLGHFRHEVGHYYWDLLIAGGTRLEEFRKLFGDERADYQQALKQHYEAGPPANWAENFISAYASTHPWEDWAESWAHVMHMVDALETAHFVGLSVKPARRDEPALSVPPVPTRAHVGDFDRLIEEWATLTYVLNNLTRGLGLADAYPFVLSAVIIAKLRFVCETIAAVVAPAKAQPEKTAGKAVAA